MLQFLRNLSIARKIAAGVAVFLGAVGLFIFLFFPARQTAQMNKYLGGKAIALAQMGAQGSAMALVFDDPSSLKGTLESLQQVQGATFVEVLRNDGSALGGWNQDAARPLEAAVRQTLQSDSACAVSLPEGLYAMAPVVSGGKRLGSVVVGVDRSDVQADVNVNRMVALLVSVVVFVSGLLTLTSMTRRLVVKPVCTVSKALENADLSFRFDSVRKDEIGALTGAFDGFVRSIRETLLQVSSSAAAVASASAEISSSTEQMAAGAHEQTSQASEVARAVEEMTNTIVANSRTASTTAESARKAKEAAEEGVRISQETLDAIRRNVDVAGEVGAVVNKLGNASEKIGDIITVIDDIADQTNLLALNAAIEAARAGEEGRGFAVVADEVRKLAERTTTATKEIADLIKNIQGLTSEGVRSVEKAAAIVEESRDMTTKTAASLRGIVDMSAHVTDLVGQIAAASEQQSGASEQISKNVEAISSVTNQTASGTQQIAHAAEDLNRLTERLQAMVEHFKLGDREQQSTAAADERSSLHVRANGKLVEQH